MSLRLMAWAFHDCPRPTGNLKHGYGSTYPPLAKLMLLTLADLVNIDDPDGYVENFGELCRRLWIHPGMATMVIDQLVKDGLLEVRDVYRSRRLDSDYHDGELMGFAFRLVGAA
jgi:hypothetical protein